MRCRIDLRVRYGRADLALVALGLAALLAGLLGTVVWNPRQAAALPAQVEKRAPSQYYLTPDLHTGEQVLSACLPGFHMASLWEILDMSNLRYNTHLGYSRKDSGLGPPATGGWVRTGWGSGSTGAPGTSNCNAWTSVSESDVGTYIFLPGSWVAGNEDLMGWGVAAAICSSQIRVWCVGDGNFVYLPLVLRYYVG